MNVVGHFSSLTAAILPPPADAARQPHVESLLDDYERQVIRRTNGFFTCLLPLQWAFAMGLTLIWSPRTWQGTESSIHPHLLAAIFLGGFLAIPPLILIYHMPYHLVTRQVVAVAQMGFSALLIDLTGGRIETHFHVFGSLAFLALYRDWRILPTATLVVAVDHLARGVWYPESVYGVPFASVWRTAEHSAWVLFEDAVLVWACLVSRREMWEICLRQDQNHQLLLELEQRVSDRTRDLEGEVRARERAADSLRESEERYRQLIANVPIGIFESNRGGQVRLANPHFLSMVGADEIHNPNGLSLAGGFMAPDDHARFWDRLEKETVVRGFEMTLTRREGEAITVLVNARLRPSRLGIEPISEGTVEDVTERLRAARELEELNQRLVVASRQAGMADVATGVLHNVGNVLTSVNLIVHDVQDRLRSSRVAHLNRAVALIEKERHRLAEFLTVDPAGRALPDFLGKLEVHLTAENKKLVRDVESLVGHFEHIREIIVVQQTSGRLYGVTEDIPPAHLVEEALRLNAETFGRHSITLKRVVAETGRVRADRHKVMQILVNLLKNAKDSVIEGRTRERMITVAIRAAGVDSVAISVGDNGVGIAPENMCKIFQHGFTTKENGHGFGLHSCVLAAREMAGDLSASSPGMNAGAVFTLSLPLAETARQ